MARWHFAIVIITFSGISTYILLTNFNFAIIPCQPALQTHIASILGVSWQVALVGQVTLAQGFGVSHNIPINSGGHSHKQELRLG